MANPAAWRTRLSSRPRSNVLGTSSLVALALAALIGLGLNVGVHRWSSSGIHAAEAAHAPQPPAPPQAGYSPKFRDLAGINQGVLPENLMTAMKIGAVRFDLPWDLVEPSRGRWTWDEMDKRFRACVRGSYLAVPMLGYTAHWAAGGQDGF